MFQMGKKWTWLNKESKAKLKLKAQRDLKMSAFKVLGITNWGILNSTFKQRMFGCASALAFLRHFWSTLFFFYLPHVRLGVVQQEQVLSFPHTDLKVIGEKLTNLFKWQVYQVQTIRRYQIDRSNWLPFGVHENHQISKRVEEIKYQWDRLSTSIYLFQIVLTVLVS